MCDYLVVDALGAGARRPAVDDGLEVEVLETEDLDDTLVGGALVNGTLEGAVGLDLLHARAVGSLPLQHNVGLGDDSLASVADVLCTIIRQKMLCFSSMPR